MEICKHVDQDTIVYIDNFDSFEELLNRIEKKNFFGSLAFKDKTNSIKCYD